MALARPRTFVISTLIVINAIVFFFWQAPSWSPNAERILEFMADNFLVSWTGLLEGRYWTLLTSVFSHNMFWHFLINMIVLKSFGSVLERILGPWRLLKLYLVAGVVGSICHSLVSAFILNSPQTPALGASGAISGLVLLVALMFPRDKLLLFFFIPIPAFWGAMAFMLFDISGIVLQYRGGGLPIGHGAHLGGALVGIVYYFYAVRPRMRPSMRPDIRQDTRQEIG